MPRRSRAPAPSSGTGRSGCSRRTRLPRARRWSRAPSRTPRHSRSRAVATPSRQSTSSASRTRSITSPPQAGRSWSSWRARNYRRWLRSKRAPMVKQLSIDTRGQGLYEVTRAVQEEVSRSSVSEGLCTVFVRHTSASLVIQENADPSARRDLERWIARLVPEGDPFYTHDAEGPDDMPAHIRAALTATSLSIPIMDHRLALGTWQGVYLWEHRRRGATRELVLHIGT